MLFLYQQIAVLFIFSTQIKSVHSLQGLLMLQDLSKFKQLLDFNVKAMSKLLFNQLERLIAFIFMKFHDFDSNRMNIRLSLFSLIFLTKSPFRLRVWLPDFILHLRSLIHFI